MGSIPHRKGIILAGGANTRLHPMTRAVPKSLLPVYDKPMIYYPLAALMQAKIADILVVTTAAGEELHRRLLGDGGQWGVRLSYAVQTAPRGIADVFLVAREFIAGQPCALMLSDNIYYGARFAAALQQADQLPAATVFACEVDNPQDFGIVEFSANGDALSLEEKPRQPKSNYAVTGCYFYDGRVCDYAAGLQPSARGELEITDINKCYLDDNALNVLRLDSDTQWFDTGTPDALLAAANYVRRMHGDGVHIACLEEIAHANGWLSAAALRRHADDLRHTAYGRHCPSCYNTNANHDNNQRRLAFAHRAPSPTTGRPLRRLFADDKARFDNFSLQCEDLLFDYSKTALTAETVDLLLALADAAKVAEQRQRLFAGDIVNQSENRPALHTALRASDSADSDSAPPAPAAEIIADVLAAREKMLAFAEQCRQPDSDITDVLHIGIGGSDLGPAMAVCALSPYHNGPRLHFVSNMDGAHLADTIAKLDAKKTLLIVSSKTFTTLETLTNANAARKWLRDSGGNPERQSVAITAAAAKAESAGFATVFPYADWVGGRYSVWGAVGLPLAIAIGKRGFEAFLAGARAMDSHFAAAPPRGNIPLLLGLVGAWHHTVCGYPTRAILPYDQRLHLLPAYTQQLDMESNGKSVRQDGAPCQTTTAPIVWGSAGTNGQHAYFQLLHQGNHIVPAEFILAAQAQNADDKQHALLAANCFAQSAALMQGNAEPDRPAFRTSNGNRPSITLLYDKLTPFALGRLLALYEARTFVEGCVWEINSFDQWGVELGKQMTRDLGDVLAESDSPDTDASTAGLMRHFRRLATADKPA